MSDQPGWEMMHESEKRLYHETFSDLTAEEKAEYDRWLDELERLYSRSETETLLEKIA